MLVEGLIPRGTFFCLNGSGGIWKSWTFTHLAICVASGLPFLDKFKCYTDAPRNSVLFVQLEENEDTARKKYRWMVNGFGLRPEEVQDLLVHYVVGQALRLDDTKRMDQLRIIIDELHPDMVLWDSARKMKAGNENDSEWGNEIAFAVKSLQEIFPSAHGIIHHWRKRSSEAAMNDPDEMGRGTGALRDAVDVWLPVERPKGALFATLHHTKMRDDEELGSFNYAVKINKADKWARAEYVGSTEDKTASEGVTADLLFMMRREPNKAWDRKSLALMMNNYTEHQVRYAIEILVRGGHVMTDRSKGGKATLFFLREASNRMFLDAQPGTTGEQPGTGKFPGGKGLPGGDLEQ